MQEIEEPDALVYRAEGRRVRSRTGHRPPGPHRQGAAHRAVGRVGQDAPPRHPRDPRVAGPRRVRDRRPQSGHATWPSASSGARTACAARSCSTRTTRRARDSRSCAFRFDAQLGRSARRRQPRSGPIRFVWSAPARSARAAWSGSTGIADRDVAAAFTNRELLVPRAVLPPLGPGEYYVADLVGCAVHRRRPGTPRGVVVRRVLERVAGHPRDQGPGGERAADPGGARLPAPGGSGGAAAGDRRPRVTRRSPRHAPATDG